MLCGLDELRPGEAGVVIHMDAQRMLLDRLKDFGFVPGTVVRCRYRSKGVMAMECRGSVIALRARDIENIMVRFHG